MDETDQSVGINWKLQAKTFVNHPALSTQHPAPSTASPKTAHIKKL
jgi:hypothetical protein